MSPGYTPMATGPDVRSVAGLLLYVKIPHHAELSTKNYETDPRTMKPGQRVRAEILLEEYESALVVPPQAIFQVDDEDTVFLREGNRLVPTTVVLGARSLSRIQVMEGLAQGDLVALRDPRQNATASFSGGGSSGSGPATPAGGMP